MTSIYLRSVPSDADSKDVRLYDHTTADSGGITHVDSGSSTSSLIGSGLDVFVNLDSNTSTGTLVSQSVDHVEYAENNISEGEWSSEGSDSVVYSDEGLGNVSLVGAGRKATQ